ncbi:L,D-transpeptidase [Caldimonas thermodepolymerans]|jgi:hypothetical protein|uniref:L,D-transpeptidase n=1 Tax=Caldimonas thermodepolymerans TaxID=215580 RepID=UPI002235E671|nr:L,D-transpeptidase [Caldimonas thermodepolymerans]UZG42732.1 L,D-transpeptidase [Caldimonas thermodepolymerans]
MSLARHALLPALMAAFLAPASLPLQAGTPAAISADAELARHWIERRADAQGRPYALVDKRAGMLYVYAADGELAGATPALTGLAPGDHAVPGIGAKPLSAIAPHERTTPAGRFDAEPGRNLDGEHVVWVDYDAGFAIHRLRPGPQRARRQRQLATPTPSDNRASYGCVVVPGDFYDRVVRPVLGSARGVVYVLPESRPVQAWLAQLEGQGL